MIVSTENIAENEKNHAIPLKMKKIIFSTGHTRFLAGNQFYVTDTDVEVKKSIVVFIYKEPVSYTHLKLPTKREV